MGLTPADSVSRKSLEAVGGLMPAALAIMCVGLTQYGTPILFSISAHCRTDSANSLRSQYPMMMTVGIDIMYSVPTLVKRVNSLEKGLSPHTVWQVPMGEQAVAVLTSIAVSITNLLHRGERTLRAVRKKCSCNPVPTARTLGWKT